MNEIIFFVLGLIGLWIGSEFITRGSLGLSRKFGLSESFIGMVILSLGTDLPEIVVSVTGAIEKNHGIDTSGIVVGNVIGSNLGQMVLTLGLVGFVGGTIKISKKEGWYQGISLILSTLLFLVLATDGLISKQDGWILLLGYLVYFLFISKSSKTMGKKTKKKKHNFGKLLALLITGLIIIFQSSTWVITTGVDLAIQFGINQIVIGAILVGIGTSLPELVVSMNALSKGAKNLAISNLVGSNVVDILLALGLGATISSWKVDRHVALFDLPFLLFTMVIVVLFMLSRRKLERKESLLMIALYVVYVSLKLIGW
ncbi:MAG: sodium:calcium antiporter [Candidatus Pacebacteria bacterium]|jgi:cation:H+ antiporter|nr:sodium:calcium antiporter [Candidatus Paceibacterota bacterium]MBT4651857.1 sodium:calcium antiporter [Candidatus Paceibacterota bacterium]MBT6755676.1 sodium:calcium antiporter [Candidatus Paceibacterota bacterium]MBT6921182.1 sodium:calcium antiporter [Candidatus Paceibacterota bacterium]